MEIFKDIPDYKDYQIYTNGIIISTKFNKRKKLKYAKDFGGYYLVSLCKNGKYKTFYVHLLMMIVFKGHKRCGHKLVVDHKNFIRTDNRLANLQIITQRKNTNKKHIKHSSKYTGVYWNEINKNWVAKITINRKLKHLGVYTIEYDAHLSYEKALKSIINI